MWPGQVWLTYDLDRVHQGSWREDACVESPEPHLVLPQLRLDDLLAELQSRLQTVQDTRDRVRGYGGTLTIGGASNGGTELRWEVPLPTATPAIA